MLAMERAVDALGLEPAMVLIDGNAARAGSGASIAIVEATRSCQSIAAASIVAKVTRDRIMIDMLSCIPATAGRPTRAIPRPSISARSRRWGRRRSTGAASL